MNPITEGSLAERIADDLMLLIEYTAEAATIASMVYATKGDADGSAEFDVGHGLRFRPLCDRKFAVDDRDLLSAQVPSALDYDPMKCVQVIRRLYDLAQEWGK